MAENETPKKKPGRPPVIKTKPPVVETPPVEVVNSGVSEAPLVDNRPPVVETPPEAEAVVKRPCPNHPKAEAVVYGMCVECYDKLKKPQKRRLYLKARLSGSNAHNYPLELRRVWKREISLIDAGLWKKPLKTKSKTKLDEALMG